MQWNKTFGGIDDDQGFAVQQTLDGGYAIIGRTNSFGKNAWLIKTNDKGIMKWNKTYGGSSWDGGYSGKQVSDGGYIITGYTYSYGIGNGDIWII